jgi:hypothetical protein
MHARDRARLVLHGAIVIVIGMLCGLPTVVEQVNGSERHWHTAHEALIMMGIWILATASILDVLALERRELSALVLSIVGMGYAFSVALVAGGIVNADAFEPGDTPLRFFVFIAATLGILGAFMAAGITVKGALATLRASRSGDDAASSGQG